jgi:predicted RecB family nuclease
VAGVQCLKRLYFQVHQPELAEGPDEGQSARLEQGDEVGLLAQSRFPGGVFVGFDRDLDDALAQTAALMENPSVPAIYEATFRHSNVLVRVDILQRRPGNRWRLIEVKSSLDPKPHYRYDLAIQHHILVACGLDISSVSLMHLNRDYRYGGGQHDLAKLFTIKDLTREVRKLDHELPALLRSQRKALAQDDAPDIAPGPQCADPYVCEFFHNCNPEPPEHHISFLPRISGKKHQDLVNLGVTLIHEIPEDFPLTGMQGRVREAVKTNRPWVSDALPRELAALRWPLYFMDFESIYPALPRFRGMRPYQQIPFQWSVHRQLKPNAELEHFEFLADDDRDPRPAFIASLCGVLSKRGPIVVYNAGYESVRLRELADELPEYRERIEAIQSRLWDLLRVVRSHIYHPQFGGSFSIKSVLPALTGMTYEGMEVAHGGQAGIAWERTIRDGVDAAEKERLRAALLAYCGLDTLATVKVLEHLRTFTSKTKAGSGG